MFELITFEFSELGTVWATKLFSVYSLCKRRTIEGVTPVYVLSHNLQHRINPSIACSSVCKYNFVWSGRNYSQYFFDSHFWKLPCFICFRTVAASNLLYAPVSMQTGNAHFMHDKTHSSSTFSNAILYWINRSPKNRECGGQHINSYQFNCDWSKLNVLGFDQVQFESLTYAIHLESKCSGI